MATLTARRNHAKRWASSTSPAPPEPNSPAWQMSRVLGLLGANDMESPLRLFEERFQGETRVDCRELGRGHLADLSSLMCERIVKLQAKGYAMAGASYTGKDPKWIAGFEYAWQSYRVVFFFRLQDPNDPRKDDEPEPDPFADGRRFEADRPAAPPVPQARPDLPPDATFTVVRDEGDHRTFRIRTAQDGGLKGQRIVEYMCGADNERDYAGFAFLKPDGAVVLWNRFRTPLGEKLRSDFLVVLEPGMAAKAGEAYAMQSGRCCRCNRKLTVPASLHRGMGPECASKGGL